MAEKATAVPDRSSARSLTKLEVPSEWNGVSTVPVILGQSRVLFDPVPVRSCRVYTTATLIKAIKGRERGVQERNARGNQQHALLPKRREG